MRITLYALTAAIGLAQTGADSGWTLQNPLPTPSTLRAVAQLDASTAIGAGEYGTILRTTDGGATWTRQPTGTANGLCGISFSDANTGTVVGERGTILHTTDGGLTWTM